MRSFYFFCDPVFRVFIDIEYGDLSCRFWFFALLLLLPCWLLPQLTCNIIFDSISSFSSAALSCQCCHNNLSQLTQPLWTWKRRLSKVMQNS
ncbi:uncharacterized protein BO97DRAFT_44851 [Aspergillus homomorphus CBS 101889]|uniref:Uncharacterized protein n=1 Tax=Aspergillus homomorphus (strain CBS 101889) TaxID=1450537 RepID=A0A395HZ21_ASPHC|nr:hypothetical protein BO97DRAFT_44851 [Aspergillus homomorphus CBS 101889]RAL13182.1 hypothetical protein BO97DRAFT_44851 [Aspergillus homomorphus CBS 101889]